MQVSPKPPHPSAWARPAEGQPENRFAAAIAQWYNRATEPKTQGTQRSPERSMRVLVVDDDAPSRKMIGFLLREEGSAGQGDA